MPPSSPVPGYDVLGRRIAKRVYSSLTGGDPGYTRFVYHGNQVAYETDSTGTPGLRYTWGFGVDDLVGVRDAAGNRYTTVQDPLHSVRGLVTTGGTWQMSQRFSPYGVRLARDSAGAIPKLRYQWTGREYDAESGLYFHRSRYYDPGAKRFVQEDRAGYRPGPNLYSYVEGQALQARDPLGLDFKRVCEAYQNITWKWVAFFGWIVKDHWVSYENCFYVNFETWGDGVPGGGAGRHQPGQADSQTDTPKPEASDTCPQIPSHPANADVDANIERAERVSAGLRYSIAVVLLDRWFFKQVTNGGRWDYKVLDKDAYDAFGNFNYGATGAAAGYSANVLLRMSGWAAERFDAGRSGDPSVVRALVGSPYSENPEDIKNILAGARYYQEGCHRKMSGRHKTFQAIRLSIVFFGLLLSTGGCSAECTLTVSDKAVQPGDGYQAVAYYRSCGVLSSSSWHVSVLLPGEKLKNTVETRGNVVILTDTSSADPQAQIHSTRLSVKWLDPHTLQVSTNRRGGFFLKASITMGFKIIYD